MKLRWMSNIETCALKYWAITGGISLCTNQNMIEIGQMAKGSIEVSFWSFSDFDSFWSDRKLYFIL